MEQIDQILRLDGKVAVIIGGTGVLCGTIARAFHSAGARVVLAGRNAETGNARVSQMSKEKGGGASFFRVDVTSVETLRDLRDDVVDRFGRVDILVNGAGMNGSTPFLEISENEWDEVMTVNLKGVFLACQTFGSRIIEQGTGGSIINISSMSGITPLSKVFAYSASKAALINLSQNLAREWATHGIRVNCIAPGFFPAEQNRSILTDSRVSDILRHTPMQRFGWASELVGVALLLASDQAGSFITGTNIPVDGGFSAMTI